MIIRKAGERSKVEFDVCFDEDHSLCKPAISPSCLHLHSSLSPQPINQVLLDDDERGLPLHLYLASTLYVHYI